MSRPTYGYGADENRPSDPADGGEGLPDLSGARGHADGAAEPGIQNPGIADPGAPGRGVGGERRRPSYGMSSAGDQGTHGSVGDHGTRGQAGAGSASAVPGGLDRPGGASGMPVGAASSEEVPRCPRHPDRISYVRCQRCGRPTCPECQRPAAVGVMCVDCAARMEREQAGARPRGALGGGLSGRPLVTYTVMGLCALVFVLEFVLRIPGVLQLLAFTPARTLAMPWTLVTSGFLHGGAIHLLLNMYALYIVGGYLERVMGHWRFAGVYLLSVIAGHVAVLLLADPTGLSWNTPTVGASGGIFGLFGSMFIVNRRLGGETSQVLVLIGLNLIITFTIPNISWQGHVGGLVLGTALTAAMFAIRPRANPGDDRAALARRSLLLHVGVLVLGLALCVGLVAAKVATSPIGSFPLLGG